jgi:alkanesulfonate monooxygenase SsuD/methylene tetrahydromethanopterin reductase-like flavin-dependent oxidoreductase (luciferase family)
MRFAVDVAPIGELADPQAIVRLAAAAEATGWDGLSTWDVLGTAMGAPAADPFVALAGVASATERLRLILSVAVLPRRRPQLVAQATATLDRLSGGRFVLGVGAGGDPDDFSRFGEDADRAVRIASLDEGLALVDAFLRGETVEHHGDHYQVSGATVGPAPVQEPRPPIWLGGIRPGALRRAAAWDGWIGIIVTDDGAGLALTPGDVAGCVERIDAEREVLGRLESPFDVALFADSRFADADAIRAYGEAGATWWLESLSPMRGSLEELVAIVEAGPPA